MSTTTTPKKLKKRVILSPLNHAIVCYGRILVHVAKISYERIDNEVVLSSQGDYKSTPDYLELEAYGKI
ncbi:hypothetical protein VNO77_23257 [Canavalia gladiata]|uniref:Uncharacterized protein n=1 Tax=Canavalia gladiata TaxID=3824 RepID=A0AAN9L5J8_CANGL